MPSVAINGLGRIGRATMKILHDSDELDLVAVNDLVPADNLAYLLSYDTVYGRWPRTVEGKDGVLTVDGTEYRLLNESDPSQLPWRDLDVDLVFECTGVFDTADALEQHLDAGARHVILSAPAKSGNIPFIVPGVNDDADRRDDGTRALIVSTASCTTNCITPVMEILDRRIGVEKATMTTAHAYTSSQGIVDGPASKWRRGRAGAANLVPTTTGAARATAKALPSMEGRFDGVAVRAPVPVGSIADIVCITRRDTTPDEINEVFREEAAGDRYRGILAVTEAPIVSADIIGDPHAAIVDVDMTQVVGGNLVKVMAWYDNEWGYAQQMVRHATTVLRDRSVAAGT